MGAIASRQSATIQAAPGEPSSARVGAFTEVDRERGPLTAASSAPVLDKEYPQLGSVVVNLSWLNPSALRSNDADNEYVVTARGGVFHGSNAPSPVVINELGNVNMIPREYPLLDSRAHQLLIAYHNGWHAISSPEVFSRHTGTCLIIGDRSNVGRSHEIKLGDCFRLGSVGVVVAELKRPNEKEERLDTSRLEYLREEALNFDHEGDEAVLAAKEESGFMKTGGDDDDENVSHTARDNVTGNLFCYMCYESHDTPEDHLVAPCACKGDTRYLHVQCLQKWYQSSLSGWRSLVIRTTGSGAPACKICGMAYKTTLTNDQGVKTNLLEGEHPGPYLSLVVVTRHDTSPELFNTKFRLNFGPGYRVGNASDDLEEDPELNPSELTIGRSSMCNMVLDYRTVSTVHAKLSFRDGSFQLQDASSSNGTMLYLQGPLKLSLNQPVRLRMGRSTLAIQSRRSLSASIKNVFGKHKTPPCTASLDELQRIMALAPSLLTKSVRFMEKEQIRNSLIRSFRDSGHDSGRLGPNQTDGIAEYDRRQDRGSRSNSPRNSGHRDEQLSNVDDNGNLHFFSSDVFRNDAAAVTDEILREIFRQHQNTLPHVSLSVSPRAGRDQPSSFGETFDGPIVLGDRPRSRQGQNVVENHSHQSSPVPSLRHAQELEGPIILGDRPRSRQGQNVLESHSRQSSPVPSMRRMNEPDGFNEPNNNIGNTEEQTVSNAAVSLPASMVYNGVSSNLSAQSQTSPAPDENCINNLVEMTSATLNSTDSDGNPLVNQAEFLSTLDRQLQMIQSFVNEATAMGMSTVSDHMTPDDRQREHNEMRAQRTIISQSIQKDELSGRSVVDNEAILIAATIIATKAKAIASQTTGKESKKAEKVAKRYSVIADKANEMIIKKAIRDSVRNSSFRNGEFEDEYDDRMYRTINDQKNDEDVSDRFDCSGQESPSNVPTPDEKVDNITAFSELRSGLNQKDEAISILEKISSNKDLSKILEEDGNSSKRSEKEQEVAIAVLLQAAERAALAGGGKDVKVTGEDVDEVVKAIREICERRANSVHEEKKNGPIDNDKLDQANPDADVERSTHEDPNENQFESKESSTQNQEEQVTLAAS